MQDLSRRGVISGRRRRYSIAGLRGVKFGPQARRGVESPAAAADDGCEAQLLTAGFSFQVK